MKTIIDITRERKKMSCMENGLIVPGIQDVSEDWTALQLALPEIALHHSTRPLIKVNDVNNWYAQAAEGHLRDAEIQNATILIAHSFGCLIAMRQLLGKNGTTNFKAAVLMNPGRNAKPSVPCPLNSSGCAETMLHGLSFSMNEELRASFIARHHDAFENRNRKPQLKQELRIHHGSPATKDLLQSYEGPSPILILRSPQDPWDDPAFADIRNAHVTHSTFEDGDHYPHVSAPEEVSKKIRSFLQAVGVLESVQPDTKKIKLGPTIA